MIPQAIWKGEFQILRTLDAKGWAVTGRKNCTQEQQQHTRLVVARTVQCFLDGARWLLSELPFKPFMGVETLLASVLTNLPFDGLPDG